MCGARASCEYGSGGSVCSMVVSFLVCLIRGDAQPSMTARDLQRIVGTAAAARVAPGLWPGFVALTGLHALDAQVGAPVMQDGNDALPGPQRGGRDQRVAVDGFQQRV